MSNTTLTTLCTLSLILASVNCEFSIRFTRGQCLVHDPIGVKNVTCSARPYNRTVTLVNMSGYVVRRLDNIMLNVQLLKKSEIIYRPYMVNFTQNYCDYLKNSVGSYYMKVLVSLAKAYSNVIHPCPFLGLVYLKNVPLDKNLVPSIWPVGSFRCDILIYTSERKVATLQFFVEVKDEIINKIHKYL